MRGLAAQLPEVAELVPELVAVLVALPQDRAGLLQRRRAEHVHLDARQKLAEPRGRTEMQVLVGRHVHQVADGRAVREIVLAEETQLLRQCGRHAVPEYGQLPEYAAGRCMHRRERAAEGEWRHAARRRPRVPGRTRVLRPRLQHDVGLQPANHVPGRRALAVGPESVDVVPMAVRRDDRGQLPAAVPADLARDFVQQLLRRRLGPPRAAEVDQHVPLAGRVVERQQEAVAEAHLVGADGDRARLLHDWHRRLTTIPGGDPR